MEYGVYGDLIIICPKPDSMYSEGTITDKVVLGVDEAHPTCT